MVPPTSHKVPRVSWYFGSCTLPSAFAYGAFTLSGWLSQNHSAGFQDTLLQSITPWCTHHGLGSSGFARRYSRNRVFFLFLRLLRCFSSPGSLPYVMDWRMDDGGLLRRVSPFRYPWITGYLLLPMAFRSLSRLSSALSAKASTLRSSSLNQAFFAASVPRLVQVVALLMKLNWFFKSYLMSFPMCSFQGTVCIAPCRSFSGFRHPLN